MPTTQPHPVCGLMELRSRREDVGSVSRRGSSPRGPSARGSIAARALVPAAMFAVIDRISYQSQLVHKLGLIEVETAAGEFAASHLCCHDEGDCDGLAGGRDCTRRCI
jgi:hypothetical protein